MKKLICVVVMMVTMGCSMANPSSPTPVIGGAGRIESSEPIGVLVPGTASLWLAGAADGVKANGFAPGEGVDVAPAQSPVFVTLKVGQVYTYLVGFGCVKNDPELACNDANGGDPVSHYAGVENGVLNLTAPLNSLIGLFEGENQPFLLGKSGELTARSGKLYLGTMDGWGWFNNSGGFAVKFYDGK